jgi:hypothetical protein
LLFFHTIIIHLNLFADHRGHDRMAVGFTSIFIPLLYIQISLPTIVAMIVWLSDLHLFSYIIIIHSNLFLLTIVAMIVWLSDLHLFSYNYYTFKSLFADHCGYDRMAVGFTSIFIQLLYI